MTRLAAIICRRSLAAEWLYYAPLSLLWASTIMAPVRIFEDAACREAII